MPILAIDTSSPWCSVAIYFSQDHYFYRHERVDNKASQYVLPWVEELMLECSIQWSDIDAIAVSIGPGSFTGIRLGIGLAQGLAYARQKPLIPIPSNDGMLANYIFIMKNYVSNEHPLYVLLDARMNQSYFASYSIKNSIDIQRNGEIQLLNYNAIDFKQVGTFITFEMQSVLNELDITSFDNFYNATPNAIGIGYCASLKNKLDDFLPQHCYPLYVRDQVALSIAQRALLAK